MPDLEHEIDQVLADNQAISKSTRIIKDAWPWSERTDGEPADHGWDWSPDVLGGNEWRPPSEAELAIHMTHMLRALRESQDGLRDIASGHVRMWLDDDDDRLHIGLDIV